MNYLEMATYLAGSVLRRGTGSDTLSLAKQALLEAQLETQRAWDWPCMKKHGQRTFCKSGHGIASDIKRITEVWISNDAGHKHHFITPSSLDLNEEGRQGGYGATIQRGKVRWWIDEQKLFIYPSLADGTVIRLDYYQLLPAYANDADNDWFSSWAWDYLSYKAAEVGSMSLWQDDRIELFRQMAAVKFMAAKQLAMDFEEGGNAGHTRPPMRMPYDMGVHRGYYYWNGYTYFFS